MSSTRCFQKWPWGSVGYQIYPRSFCDSNNDGVGDLQGITSKLDYLNDGSGGGLGITAVWICPFYVSPMVDFGYDVSDYCNVDPIFGSLEDFDKLLFQSHRRGIKVFIDFVPNHTSDLHPWFLESRASKFNKRRNWYVWKDPRDGGLPPNNWLSVFGGSAWEFDKKTSQYYLHSFLKEQPDLNWENPEVIFVMQEVLRFWLRRGVDGFRVDAVSWLSKDKRFRDDPLNADFREGMDPYHKLTHLYSKDGAELFGRLKMVSKVLEEFSDRFMMTESYPDTRGEVGKYIEFYRFCKGARLAPFNFELIFLPWKVSAYKKYIDNFQSQLRDIDLPVFVFGNLDRPRLVGRIKKENLRVAAMLLLTLPGLPFIYYGDEIGMSDVYISRAKIQDPFGRNVAGLGFGRDPQRTPMQWSHEKYAGFSSFKPWLPIAPNYKQVNAESLLQKSGSLVCLYKKLIKLRNESKALSIGRYVVFDGSTEVFGYIRSHKKEKVLVLLNFSDEKAEVSLRGLETQVVFSTFSAKRRGKRIGPGVFCILPNEGVLGVLK